MTKTVKRRRVGEHMTTPPRPRIPLPCTTQVTYTLPPHALHRPFR